MTLPDSVIPPANSGLRVPELDGLRGLAILLIIIWHYFSGPYPVAPGTFAALLFQPLQIAWSGVDLFFVLSGYLIGGILLDHRASRKYYKTFYLRRIYRIFPLYYLWIALFILIPVVLDGLHLAPYPGLFSSTLSVWPYLFFLQNIAIATSHSWGEQWVSITWSLAIEEQFYLLLPLLIRLLPAKRLPWVLGGIIACAPLIRWLLYGGSGDPGLRGYLLLPCRADSLLLGVFCAWLVRRESFRPFLAARRWLLPVLLMLLAAGTLALAYLSPSGSSWSMNVFGFTWLAMFYAVLLLAVIVHRAGPLAAVFRFTPLRRLGLIAYGVYLMHQSVKIAMRHGIAIQFPAFSAYIGGAAMLLLSFIVTVLAAALLWNFFEKKMIAKGHEYHY